MFAGLHHVFTMKICPSTKNLTRRLKEWEKNEPNYYCILESNSICDESEIVPFRPASPSVDWLIGIFQFQYSIMNIEWSRKCYCYYCIIIDCFKVILNINFSEPKAASRMCTFVRTSCQTPHPHQAIHWTDFTFFCSLSSFNYELNLEPEQQKKWNQGTKSRYNASRQLLWFTFDPRYIHADCLNSRRKPKNPTLSKYVLREHKQYTNEPTTLFVVLSAALSAEHHMDMDHIFISIRVIFLFFLLFFFQFFILLGGALNMQEAQAQAQAQPQAQAQAYP